VEAATSNHSSEHVSDAGAAFATELQQRS